MNHIPTSILFLTIFLLIVFSAFFSSSETGLMSLNRYRLKHLAEQNHRGARLASRLLERPDRLLGLILLGNNFVNLLAASLGTILAQRLLGENGIAVSTFALTIILLIFAELAPKTMAALHPERIAFPSAYVYTPMLKLLYPFVVSVNSVTNGLLRIFGVHTTGLEAESMSRDELRTVVVEAGKLIPQKHQDMLLGILSLENATVEDIMVPRNEITALDLDDDWDEIMEFLMTSQRTRIPVYRGGIDNVVGIIHMRRVISLLAREELNRENLEALIRDAYFIPLSTSLYQQLVNFQANKRRTAMVVDEYGDVQGLVTLEDILEEVVGEFTTVSPTNINQFHPQEDGSFLIAGNTHIREINRSLGWQLPTDGPKTLNGLIVEHMEFIPESNTSLKIADHPIEIIKATNNAVIMTRVSPAITSHRDDLDDDDIMDGG